MRYNVVVSSLNLSLLNDESKALSLSEFTTKYTRPFFLHEETQTAIEVDSSQTMGLCYMPTQIGTRQASERSVYQIGNEGTLGRSGGNDIVVNDPSVSKVHAHLWVDSERKRLKLKDAGSRNGTYCSGVQAEPDTEVEVKSGTIVTFGRVPLRFIIPEEFFLYLKVLRENGEL